MTLWYVWTSPNTRLYFSKCFVNAFHYIHQRRWNAKSHVSAILSQDLCHQDLLLPGPSKISVPLLFLGPLTCGTRYIQPLSPSCPYLCDATLGHRVCAVCMSSIYLLLPVACDVNVWASLAGISECCKEFLLSKLLALYFFPTEKTGLSDASWKLLNAWWIF